MKTAPPASEPPEFEIPESERLIGEQVERAAASIADRYRREATLRLKGNGVFNALATFALRRGGILPGDGGERLTNIFWRNDILLDIISMSPASSREIVEGILGYFLLSKQDVYPLFFKRKSLKEIVFDGWIIIFIIFFVYLGIVLYLTDIKPTLNQLAWALSISNAIQLGLCLILAGLCIAPLRHLRRASLLRLAERQSYLVISSRYSKTAHWRAKARESNASCQEGCGSCFIGCLCFGGLAMATSYLASWLIIKQEYMDLWHLWIFIISFFIWIQSLWLISLLLLVPAAPASELAQLIQNWRAQDWPAREES
jgi:hypothetical protein